MALWIIGGILLLLILLLLLRVGVHLRFGEQLELTVIAGPARIQLLPRPEKTETEQKTKQKKKAKREAQEKKPAKQREKLSLSFEDVRSALPYLWEGLKRALARTRRGCGSTPCVCPWSLPGRTLLPWRRPMAGPAAPCGR